MFGIVLIAALLQTPSGAKGSWFDSNPCPKGKIHNYYFGHRTPEQRLFYEDHPHFDSKLMRVRTEEVMLPADGEMAKGIIGYIEVLDAVPDGQGGCAYIENGGVGSPFVFLKLKSQRNQGMDFSIRVYGSIFV